MEKAHYLKTANKIKTEGKLNLAIVDILENETGDLTVCVKKGEKQDYRQFKDDLGAALGLKVEVQTVAGRELMSIIGGIGRCDQELCCHRWLTAPQNVSTQTMVNQDLSGIPGDYLGMCGKLLCCLLYEEETFKLECAFGESLRARLKKESVEIQGKVAKVKEGAVTKNNTVNKEEKHRKVIRRFIKKWQKHKSQIPNKSQVLKYLGFKYW